jgi:hypothetical protein
MSRALPRGAFFLPFARSNGIAAAKTTPFSAQKTAPLIDQSHTVDF